MPPRFDVSLEKLTRVPCVSLTHRGGSFRVLFASVGSHGNSFSLFLPAYLSISPVFVVLFHPICSSTDLSLIFLSRFTFPLFSSPPPHRPLTSCANVPKSIYDITACSRATSSPTDSTKAGAFHPRLLFPTTFTARYPRQFHTNTTNSSAIFTADGTISCVTTAAYR